MHIKNELQRMTERMFISDLLDAILSAYKTEMDDAGYGASEGDYRRGVAALADALDDIQKTQLSQLENLQMENVRYAVQFSFSRGMYVGFEQFFVEAPMESPFYTLVENELLSQPQMKKYAAYSSRKDQCNQLSEHLSAQLDDALKEHLVSIDVAWDDRFFGVLRHSFYLGYRHALSILHDIHPLSTSISMTNQILITEHELGFTSTVEEREHAAHAASDR